MVSKYWLRKSCKTLLVMYAPKQMTYLEQLTQELLYTVYLPFEFAKPALRD